MESLKAYTELLAIQTNLMERVDKLRSESVDNIAFLCERIKSFSPLLGFIRENRESIGSVQSTMIIKEVMRKLHKPTSVVEAKQLCEAILEDDETPECRVRSYAGRLN